MSTDNADLTVPRMYTRAELDEAVGEALRRVVRELERHDLDRYTRHVQRVADALGVTIPREVTLAELTRLVGQPDRRQLAVLKWTGEKDPDRTWSQPEVETLINIWYTDEAHEEVVEPDDEEAALRMAAHVRRRAVKGGRV